MKKLLAFICVLCLLAAMVSGCSKSKTPAKADLTAAPTGSDAPATGPWADDPNGLHPMLYRVTGAGGQASYLFGTIHIGDERIGQALTMLEPTLKTCTALAVEFDVIAYEQNIAAQTSDMLQFMLQDGTSVKDHMPEEVYQQAKDLLSKADLSPELMSYFNLAMWSQLVEQAAVITQSKLRFENAMDRALIEKAGADGLEVRDVESAKFQYQMIASFPEELNLLMIRKTLDGLSEYGEGVEELYEAWCRGDAEKLRAINEETDEDLTAEEQKLVEDYNRKMLDERNLGMRDKFVQWLQAGDKVFFAVGAGHLVGEAGLVNLLRQAGYTVEPVRYHEG